MHLCCATIPQTIIQYIHVTSRTVTRTTAVGFKNKYSKGQPIDRPKNKNKIQNNKNYELKENQQTKFVADTMQHRAAQSITDATASSTNRK